jgi:predicted metal-dependent peptidase
MPSISKVMIVTNSPMLSPEDKIIKAKIQLLKEKPFFGYLISYLRIEENSKLACGTAGVNASGHLVYDKDWIGKLTNQQVKFVLAHEVMHLGLEHLQRGNKYDHKIFNVAADIKVNEVLQKNNFTTIDGCIKIDGNQTVICGIKVDKIDQKCTEDIYYELYKKAKVINVLDFDQHYYQKDGDKSDGNGDGNDDKKGNKDGKGGANGAMPDEKDAMDWKDLMAKAFALSKLKGDVPAGLDRSIDDLLNPKNSWRAILRKYVTHMIPSDYTWTRPARKSIACGFYLPSTKREEIEVTVAIDTSGSIDNDLLKDFLSEIIGISREFDQVKVRILTCDTMVYDDYTLTNGNVARLAQLKIKGGGGTDFKPVFNKLKDSDTKALIYFTDGYGDFPKEAPRFTTIWALSEKSIKPPFGEIVYVRD